MRLSDNTILITGGTSGIGRGLAERLSDLGNTVIICGRRQSLLDAIAANNARIVTRLCDISDERQRQELADWASANYPNLNILINNAGIQLANDLTHAVDVRLIRGELEVNFVAPVHLSSLVVQQLQSRENAAIVNISSGLAFVPIAMLPVYSASKAALHSYTLSLRQQLSGLGIKVFEIAPPSVDTELGHQQRKDKTQTHGGMPVSEFVDGALQALQNDAFEAGIGSAANLMAQREALFAQLNA